MVLIRRDFHAKYKTHYTLLRKVWSLRGVLQTAKVKIKYVRQLRLSIKNYARTSSFSLHFFICFSPNKNWRKTNKKAPSLVSGSFFISKKLHEFIYLWLATLLLLFSLLDFLSLQQFLIHLRLKK